MRTRASVGFLAAIAISLSADPCPAAISGLQRVASGLSSPMFVTNPPGDRDRLFIAQRGGAIRILNLNTGSLLTTPFLTMTGLSSAGEGGFLGLAFHPDYYDPDADGFGKFYVKVTTAGSDLTVQVREYSVSETDPNLADPGSMRAVLTYTNPQTNHVGGWIGFSPIDHHLYIANGDGGGGNDSGPGHTDEPTVKGNAQDITSNLLGKMLRINPLDPDGMGSATYSIPPDNPFVGATGDDEIWAYGLRNPFRDSFDRITGDLWIGDVGQGAREEVDFQPASSDGGENYGWRLREGSIPTPSAGIGGPCSGCIEPVYDYQRPIADPAPIDPAITAINQYRGVTVIGGYVYRGPDPSLQGQYVFLDRDGGTAGINYWMFDPDDPYGSVQNIDLQLTPNVGSPFGPVSMGEDAKGNLYFAFFSGEVYRIATNALLKGDFDADGDVDDDDLDVWKAAFGSALPNPAADGNGNGVADAADYVTWRKNLGMSVHAGAGSGAAVPEPIAVIYVIQLIGLSAAASIFRNRSRPQASH
jgi:glucose/arabinose dehydrogenase